MQRNENLEKRLRDAVVIYNTAASTDLVILLKESLREIEDLWACIKSLEQGVIDQGVANKVLGRQGGLARKKALSPERLSEIARLAVRARHDRNKGLLSESKSPQM